MRLTVAIVSYGRDEVLVNSLAALLALDPPPWELLLVDQTPRHDPVTEAQLSDWQQQGVLCWLRLPRPSITIAMNRALQEAKGERVLFLDDDIIPDRDLLAAHQRIGESHPKALVAGRILQPWHRGLPDPEGSPFLFNSLAPHVPDAFIGSNFSLSRQEALAIGGFDTNFVQVAYRYEAEFAHRWRQAGFAILYAPDALIHHLKAERGGTRSYGEHLTTLRPDHAVGRYYFRLCTQSFPQALAGSFFDLLRSIRTRHHLGHPWWIPLTLLAEARGLLWALRLHQRGPGLLTSDMPGNRWPGVAP